MSFRFYGHAPGDWFDGDAHHYEIQFVDAPDAATKARLARAFEQFLAFGPVASSEEPWLWSQRFARFEVRERWIADHIAQGIVAKLLWQLHRIAALRDVVYLDVREPGQGAWEAASIAEQARPDPGPPYPEPLSELVIFRRDIDAALPVARVDPDFEQARADERRVLHQVRISNAGDGTIGLRPVDRAPVVDDPGWREHIPFDVGPRTLLRGAVSSDRGLALVSGNLELWVIDLQTEAARRAWVAEPAEGNIVGVAFTSQGWAVKTVKQLHLLGSDASVLRTVRSAGSYLHALRGGHALVTGRAPGSTRIYGCTHDRLKLLATLKIKSFGAAEHAGVGYVDTGRGSWAEITGLEAAVEGFIRPLVEKAARRANKARRGRKPPARPRVRFEPVDLSTLEPWPTRARPSADELARHGKGALVHRGSDGAYLVSSPKDGNAYALGAYDNVTWVLASGDRLALTQTLRAVGHGPVECFSLDESAAWVAWGGTLIRCDPEARAEVVAPRGTRITSFAAVDEDSVLVLRSKALQLCTRADGKWTVADRLEIGTTAGMAVAKAPRIAAVLTTKAARTVVVAVRDGRLCRLGSLRDRIQSLTTRGDAIVGPLPDGTWVRLVAAGPAARAERGVAEPGVAEPGVAEPGVAEPG